MRPIRAPHYGSVSLCLAGLTLSFLTIGFAVLLAQVPPPPRGEVLAPRIDTTSVSADHSGTMRFNGWVDFAHSKGSVVVEVLRDGNKSIVLDEAQWERAPFTLNQSETPTVVNGENRYYWDETRPMSDLFSGRRWPDGGTARLRFRAVPANRQSIFLRIFDQNLVSGLGNVLVIADSQPTPVSPGAGHETPNYLDRHTPVSENDTATYYSTVRKGPMNDGAPIATSLDTLDKFKTEYFTSAGSCATSTPELQARYFNNGDLGIGRQMHCVQNPCTQVTACYVQNYAGRDAAGKPVFNSFASAKQSLADERPFATVAMVNRGMMSRESPNKVFFVVYDGSGKQTKIAQLDSKGFNKSIPSNCLVCHGSHADFDSRKGTVVGAAFLPFDLESFRFFDEGFRHPLFPSRSEQEPVLKRLNQLVYQTDLMFNDDARELILGWYGGTLGRPGEFPSTTFQGQFVPLGWRNNDSNIQLYRQVVAKSCRTCHISNSSIQTTPTYTFGMATELTFGSFAKLSANAGRAWLEVCQQNRMPNSEQTLGLFWQGGGRPQFLNRAFFPESSAVQGCGVKALEPASASAASAVQSLQLVDRFAAESCACATPDCLADADRRYFSEAVALGTPPVDRNRYASAMGKAVKCRLDVTTASAPGAAAWHETAAQLEVERSRLTLQGETSR